MKSISIYKKADHKRSKDTIPFDLFLDNIRNGYWQDWVLPIRAMTDKKQREEAKQNVPMVTLSGTFSERRDDSMLEPSGFIGIDIDDVPDPEELKSLLCPDKYVYAAFTSISGRGLCVVFKINPDKHREAFAGIVEYLFNNYHVVCDPTSVNPSRSRFISFDPHIYIAGNCEKFTYYPKPKEPKKIEKFLYVNDDFNFILSQIQTGNVNITQDSYHVWLRIGFALCHKFGEAGRQHYHFVSQYSSKYDSQICDKQYDACMKHHASMKLVTISTFYYYCKEAGLQIYSERTKKIAYSAYNGNKGGLQPDSIAENLERFEDIKGNDVLALINQVINNGIKVDDDTVLDQLEMFIRQNYSLKRNEITLYIENNGKPLEQKDLNSIYIKARKIFDTGITYDLFERLIHSDFVPNYHPFMEFFNEHGGQEIISKLANEPAPLLTPGNLSSVFVKEFPCITKLFACINASNGNGSVDFEGYKINPFVLYFGVKWLVGIMSAIYGEHSPLVLVLCGGQNSGKTEWFRRLMPRELNTVGKQKYYAESKLDAGKDDEILMTKKAIIMDDEMSGKSKKDTLKINTLTSKDIFTLREPYGRGNVDLKRLAVLCGTSNYLELLADTTGNRRIIPIHVISIDHKMYNSIDKIELWMEIFKLYHMKFNWRVSQIEEIEYLGVDKSIFEITQSESELITKYFEPRTADEHTIENEFSSTDIKVYIEERTRQHLSLDMIGKQMRKLGFKQVIKKVNNTTRRAWIVNKLITNNDTTGNQKSFFTVTDHTVSKSQLRRESAPDYIPHEMIQPEPGSSNHDPENTPGFMGGIVPTPTPVSNVGSAPVHPPDDLPF